MTGNQGAALQRVTAALREHGSTGGPSMWQCPADSHEDRTASLSVGQGDVGAVICCQRGCDTKTAILPVIGLSFRDLFDEPRKVRDQAPRRVVAEYRYTDELGELLFVKVRFEPKTFAIKRPDGRGGWAWNLGRTRRPLYRLPEVLAAVQAGQTVYLVEGEKGADRLVGLGQVATCSFNGAAKDSQRPKWRPEYGDLLRDAVVEIVADRDGAGLAHARAAAADLTGKARSVVIKQSAILTEHADIADHLDAGYGLDDLVPVDAGDPVPPPIPVAQQEESVILPAIPKYPTGSLIGPLRDFVDWAQRDGLHPEAAAAAGLAALVTLTGPARLEISSVKTVRAILWIVLVGVASSGKSPTFEHAFARIREHYAEQREGYEIALQGWKATGEGDEPTLPEPLEFDDATVEAVARWLMARKEGDQDPSGAVIDDELASTLEGLNQYRGGQGADRSKWLKLWTGADLHIKRVGKGGAKNEVNLYVREPTVSVAGPLTPDNLHLLGRQGSGFRPRFLVHLAPAQQPAWNHAGKHPDSWVNCINSLLGRRDRRIWNLRGDAWDEWERARKRWDAQQDDPEPDDVLEALRKADAQAYRIALVIAESMAPGKGGTVPVEAMRGAIAHMDYVIACWRALPGGNTMAASRAEDVMDAMSARFLAWLESRPKGSEGLADGTPSRPRATRREVQQWSHLKAAKVTMLIMEHGERYPGCVVTTGAREGKGHRGAAGGLPTTYVYAPERTRINVAATANRGIRTVSDPGGSAGQGTTGSLLREATANQRNGEHATANQRACTACGKPMTVIERGQTSHPMCGAA